MAAHREIRSRLIYEVGVIVAQKGRKADRERRLQQYSTTSHANVTSADAAGIPDAADAADIPDASDGANAADTDVVVNNNDDAEFDVASFQCKAAATDTAAPAAAAAATAAAATAATAAAAAEDVDADDTGRLHWGKKWVAAAAAAEKGEKLI